MAAEMKISVFAELTGLGDIMRFLPKKYTLENTPTLKLQTRQIQAVADTEEALEVGDITTIHMILMECISKDCEIDTSFSSTFSAEITILEGESQVFKPSGTVYIRNTAAEGAVSTVEYTIVGE